jgi:prephenate dehydrogenase
VSAQIPAVSRDLKELDVVIVGLGLMGASLAGALRGRCRAVRGIARRQETLQIASERGLVDEGTLHLESGVRDADVVVLATPVGVILSLLDEIGPLLPEGCIVVDMGSTKSQIVSRMERLPGHIQPLGGHPMCGKEVSGIEAAEPSIFNGCTFVLTPLKRTSDDTLSLVCALVAAVGANPLELDAQRHDRLVATISHLPYLLACALVRTAAHAAGEDATIWDVASSGFRDTSRLAASDVTMMLDILMTNQDAVLDALEICELQTRSLAGLIRSVDKDALRNMLTRIRAIRAEYD